MDAQTEPSQAIPYSTREAQWGWAVVFLANLPVPLIFGFLLTSGDGGYGVFGMLAGVVAMWLIGHIVVARVPRVRSALISASGFFALSQVVPVAQFAAGGLALNVCGVQIGSWLPAPTAFVVTFLTGAQLFVAALVCRLLVRVCSPFARALVWLFAGHPNRSPS